MILRKNQSLEEILRTATDKVTMDIENLVEQREDALSAFRSTAIQLKEINESLTENVKTLEDMDTFIKAKQHAANVMIADNEAVRSRIMEIIGMTDD